MASPLNIGMGTLLYKNTFSLPSYAEKDCKFSSFHLIQLSRHSCFRVLRIIYDWHIHTSFFKNTAHPLFFCDLYSVSFVCQTDTVLVFLASASEMEPINPAVQILTFALNRRCRCHKNRNLASLPVLCDCRSYFNLLGESCERCSEGAASDST